MMSFLIEIDFSSKIYCSNEGLVVTFSHGVGFILAKTLARVCDVF